jgi:hypothetical protein
MDHYMIPMTQLYCKKCERVTPHTYAGIALYYCNVCGCERKLPDPKESIPDKKLPK